METLTCCDVFLPTALSCFSPRSPLLGAEGDSASTYTAFGMDLDDAKAPSPQLPLPNAHAMASSFPHLPPANGHAMGVEAAKALQLRRRRQAVALCTLALQDPHVGGCTFQIFKLKH